MKQVSLYPICALVLLLISCGSDNGNPCNPGFVYKDGECVCPDGSYQLGDECMAGDRDLSIYEKSDTITEQPVIDGDSTPNSLFEWQSPPGGKTENQADLIEYCDNLVLDGKDDWRLPTIIELRYFLDGCGKSEPKGICGVTHRCNEKTCREEEDCKGCANGQGPASGCYWDNSVESYCNLKGENAYWSSTSVDNHDGFAWFIDFASGFLDFTGKATHFKARCVRDR